MYLPILAATLVAATSPAAAAPAPTLHLPRLAVVFRLAPPASSDSALAAADVGLRAPEELGESLAALRSHPGAHLSFAVSPSYLDALDQAGAGNSALTSIAGGAGLGQGANASAALEILERHRPLDPSFARTSIGARYLTLATAAASRLAGDTTVSFSEKDASDFAQTDAAVVLAGSGLSHADSTAALARVDKTIADELRADVRAGTVELIALPDFEPVLPLIVDAGGKTVADPRVVAVGARADAAWLIDDAVRRVNAFASAPASCGFYSPHGAYDDATAALIKAGGASFALFSDRVVHGAGGQGTEAGLDSARAAALHAYSLTIDRGVTLPTLFWSEPQSAKLGVVAGSSTAMSQSLVDIAVEAAAEAPDASPHILVVRLDADGPWSQRPDAAGVTGRLVATIAHGDAGRSTTIAAFVRANQPTATAYGFPPNAESGSFNLWMGTPNQSSLWKALADARKAAGGDAALSRPDVRSLLFSAEDAHWFALPTLPLSSAAIGAQADRFRAIIAGVYRAAGIAAPASIAPLKLASPAPVPSAPGAKASPAASPPPPAPSPSPKP